MPNISPTAQHRFDAKYRVDAKTGCWMWVGARLQSGYGLFGLYVGSRRTNETAHRASWILENGEIPDGMMVCHRCDNPPCVNPDHLFLGTGKDNMQDALAKGRCYIQPRITHCKRGHEMTEDNVIIRINPGTRRCKACEALLYAESREHRIRYLKEYRRRKRLAV